MKDKLNHLHSAMDQTVFRNKEFTEGNKNNVRQKIAKHQQRQSLNIFWRFEFWFKPVLSVAVCLFLFMGGIYIVLHQSDGAPKPPTQNQGSTTVGDDQHHEESTKSPDSEEKSMKSSDSKNDSREDDLKDNEKGNEKKEDKGDTKAEKPSVPTLISNILKKAKDGKVTNTPFTAGETSVEEIQSKWGEPDINEPPKSVKTDKKIKYMTYLQKQAAFGYGENAVVFDVRSYDGKLGKITLADIKKSMGDPDKTPNYKDKTHYQNILVYDVNDIYQLKWIVRRPDKKVSNPTVDHIDVYNKKAAEK